MTPGGVALSLITTLMVSDFQDKFGVKGSDWRTTTVLLAVAFMLWTLVAVFKSFKRISLDDLMSRIAEASEAPLRHYALPIFRAKDGNGVAHILVYHDPDWACYLLPYVSLQPDQTDPEDASEPAADRFGLPKRALRGHELEGQVVRDTKVSEVSHKITNYRFTFYLMVVATSYEPTFAKKNFEVQGRRYSWLTIEEILADPGTTEKNGKVLRHIRDNRNAFFGGKLPFSIIQSLRA